MTIFCGVDDVTLVVDMDVLVMSACADVEYAVDAVVDIVEGVFDVVDIVVDEEEVTIFCGVDVSLIVVSAATGVDSEVDAVLDIDDVDEIEVVVFSADVISGKEEVLGLVDSLPIVDEVLDVISGAADSIFDGNVTL